MAIFQTNNRQAYYLRLSQQVSDVIVNIENISVQMLNRSPINDVI